MAKAALERQVFSVSELNRAVRGVLEGHFGLVWVQGELSNLSRPSSGHWYFSLKDKAAQVRCAMFRSANARLKFRVEAGQQVMVRGRVGLYEARGDYQIIVEHMEPAGEGALRLAFEQLKAKLEAEGLFDPERKQPIPAYPRVLGVVTSPTGAALRDILSVLRRRCPGLPVIVYPVPVQGAAAAPAIRHMLARAAARAECDVLILARGGGSLEDLWSFNDEGVARAVADCPLPLVCGVGHEIDFTIADFCADLRAPTPSAAAELASPDTVRLRRELARRRQALVQHTRRHLAAERRQLEHLQRRLVHPGRRLQQLQQRLDNLELGLHRAVAGQLERRRAAVARLTAELRRLDPRGRIRLLRERLAPLRGRLVRATLARLSRQRAAVNELHRALRAVSPQGTLERGYAIVSHAEGGGILRSVRALESGAAVRTRLADGSFDSVVGAVQRQDDAPTDTPDDARD